ncbi:hypothetical protein GCM10011332_18190 [Terasakiella brassicae]|uniref:Uncharacterized protein n=1 Tax=Terasakiella brassicae TaxID=1634917 RepID=A0A917BZI5_9PROT|nr:hypothetical protein [Terasakiella brassicae]GGF64452.1 hypothetical protein GCM10011332_18190 [Terasakiella brassicae]
MRKIEKKGIQEKIILSDLQPYKQAGYSRVFIVVFTGLILLKLFYLFSFGPVFLPDSTGYIKFANLVLNEKEWINHVDLRNAFWQPETAFRSIGYPAFLAFNKLIFGELFDWSSIGIQITLSLYTSYLIYQLSDRFLKNEVLALFCASAHALSQGLLMDQCLLTDSLNTSLMVIVLCTISIKIIDRSPPKTATVLGLGTLILIAFSIREAGNFLQFLLWPIVLYWIIRNHPLWSMRIFLFMLFISPIFLGVYGYKTWNEHRTDKRFITTAGQSTMFFPVFKLKKQGIDALKDDPLFQGLPEYVYPLDEQVMINSYAINKHLHSQHNFNAVEISNYAFTTFFRLWKTYPVGMVAGTFSEIREKQLFSSFMPVETWVKTHLWARGSKPFQKRRDMMEKVKTEGRYELLLAYIARHLERIISILISAAFVIGGPILFYRTLKKTGYRLQNLPDQVWLITFYWLLYFGYTFAYAMVHLEQRYLLPVVPFLTISGVLILKQAFFKLKTVIRPNNFNT